MSAIVRFWMGRCFAVRKLGMAMAATMPMMATITRPPTMTITTIMAVFVAFVVPGAGLGAPLLGFPHRGHGAFDTASTALPQWAQYCMVCPLLFGWWRR